eukprot:SAG31_NODE_2169_length_6266_cov_11.590076_4_plen_91_part_00
MSTSEPVETAEPTDGGAAPPPPPADEPPADEPPSAMSIELVNWLRASAGLTDRKLRHTARIFTDHDVEDVDDLQEMLEEGEYLKISQNIS